MQVLFSAGEKTVGEESAFNEAGLLIRNSIVNKSIDLGKAGEYHLSGMRGESGLNSLPAQKDFKPAI